MSRYTREELESKNLIAYSKLKGFYYVLLDNVVDEIKNTCNDSIITVFGSRDEVIYLYSNGIWEPKGRQFLKEEIEDILGEFSKNGSVAEVIEKIKRQTAISREEFERKPNDKICLKNVVLDLSIPNNIKIIPHSPNFNFQSKLDITYNPEAKCPKILKFIDETFEPSDKMQFQEWLGMHLEPKYRYKKAAIIEGQQNTGKSVVVNLMTSFLGRKNVSGLSLQQVAKGRTFDLLALKDKFANIHDDLSDEDMSSGGGLKKATGGAPITGEIKFSDMFTFVNYAKFTFTCNKIPPLEKIDDEAYYGRWLHWLLDNQISKEEMNPLIIEELTTPEELSGLLNWAIEGFQRLVCQNGFTNEKTSDEMKKIMLGSGNSVSSFAQNVLEKETNNKITKEQMYEAYCIYCEKEKFAPFTKEAIGRRLSKYANYVIPSSSGKERYWLNAKFKIDTDTYYTIQKNMSKPKSSIIQSKDVLFQKLSEPSDKKEPYTYDTSVKEDIERRTEQQENEIDEDQEVM